MKFAMKNSLPGYLTPGVLSSYANGFIRTGLRNIRKGQRPVFDVGAGCVYKQVVVFPRTHFCSQKKA